LEEPAVNLADCICWFLSSVSGSRKMARTLQKEADQRGITLEQLLAAALTECIRERFVVTQREVLN
jgi:hypothetical protein